MANENTVSSNLSSAFIDCSERFRLLPIQCDKGAYRMVIEMVWSFLHVLERTYMAMKPSAAMI